MKIVIADDEKLIRQGLAYIIRQMEESDEIAASCSDGEEALSYCLREGDDVDVLITDVCMPGMDGLDLIAELARRCPHIQTVVMSGYGEFDYVRRAMREGAIDYLLKPIIKNELQEVLERMRQQKKLAAGSKEDKRESPMIAAIHQDHLLSALFHPNPGVAPDARAYLENGFGIAEGEVRLFAAGVTIDEKADSRFQEADRMLFQYFVRKMAEEALFQQQPACGTVWQGQDDFVVLLFFVPKGEEERETAMADSLKQLLAILSSHVQYPVTIGVSSGAERFSDMPKLLLEVQAALRARLTIGTGQVIGYEASQNLQRQWSVQPDAFHKVVTATVLGDAEALEKELGVFMDDLYEAGIHPEVLLDIVLRLFLRVESMMEAKGIVRTGDPGAADLGKLLGELQRCPTWSVLESEVKRKLAEWSSLIQEHSRQIKPTFITDAVHYIHEHYRNDLTLAEVADVVGLYPTYLSEQFKQHMGVKFVDYVIQVRMDRAKKLLRETNKPSFEICEKVGYATPAHFTKVFKSKVGCTPLEYREGWRGIRKI
ncbi:response regulator transcription factor [Cohnella fermenti]|nr:response regulator [Cohnella fermenti]